MRMALTLLARLDYIRRFSQMFGEFIWELLHFGNQSGANWLCRSFMTVNEESPDFPNK